MKKIDVNKVYKFIGQAVVYGILYATTVIGCFWAFTQNTVF